MFLVYFSIIPVFLLPVFIVLVIWGRVKKSKKLTLIGGLGCVASIVLFFLGILLITIHPNQVRESIVSNQEQRMQEAVDYYQHKLK